MTPKARPESGAVPDDAGHALVSGKLDNENFLRNAPPDVVTKEQLRQTKDSLMRAGILSYWSITKFLLSLLSEKI